MSKQILYIFGGEKAQGAEIVIERLFSSNRAYKPHLIISPGKFASHLIELGNTYPIKTIAALKKLNRSSDNSLIYLFKAVRNYLAVSFLVLKYITRNNIKVIHANTIVPASYLIPAVIFSHLFKKKIIWIWSDHDMRYFSRIDAIFSKICFKIYDRTIVVSNAVLCKYKISPKVNLLYNGLDLNIFKPNLTAGLNFKNTFNIPGHHLVLGIAASIHPDKGQLELLELFVELTASHPHLTLLLAGNYSTDTMDYTLQVKKYISENDHVIHVGYIEKMQDFYNACDIIINNSNDQRSESLGTTIYEAMACEKIVVASSTGGTPEIISDNADGILFEPGNKMQLLDLLKYSITHFSQLQLMRSLARQKVADYFSIDNMIANYNFIIENVTETNMKQNNA